MIDNQLFYQRGKIQKQKNVINIAPVPLSFCYVALYGSIVKITPIPAIVPNVSHNGCKSPNVSLIFTYSLIYTALKNLHVVFM